MLDDVKGNWERRLSCLRRLQSLALVSLADSSLAPALVKLVRSGLVYGIRSCFLEITSSISHSFSPAIYVAPSCVKLQEPLLV